MLCPVDFTIASIRALHGELVALADSGGAMAIDGRLVERADAAAVQLLCAAALEARRREMTFTLAPSEPLAEVVRVLGVTHLLGIRS